jgi:hypothetical protein
LFVGYGLFVNHPSTLKEVVTASLKDKIEADPNGLKKCEEIPRAAVDEPTPEPVTTPQTVQHVSQQQPPIN